MNTRYNRQFFFTFLIKYMLNMHHLKMYITPQIKFVIFSKTPNSEGNEKQLPPQFSFLVISLLLSTLRRILFQLSDVVE
jgi:hypothetical protein